MGPVKDVKTSNDDDTMAARPSGDEAVRCDPPLVPGDKVDDVPGDDVAGAAGRDDNDNALQAEEPGYGYGV